MRSRNQYPRRSRVPRAQRGAALLISLIILLVMTVLAVTTSRTTTLQERMAGNMRSKDIAFQASELTLRIGERRIEDLLGQTPPIPSDPSSCSGCLIIVSGVHDPLDDSTWASGGGVHSTTVVEGTSGDPQYFLELQQTIKESPVGGQSTDERVKMFYRITARAAAGNSAAQSILRSVYVLRF